MVRFKNRRKFIEVMTKRMSGLERQASKTTTVENSRNGYTYSCSSESRISWHRVNPANQRIQHIRTTTTWTRITFAKRWFSNPEAWTISSESATRRYRNYSGVETKRPVVKLDRSQTNRREGSLVVGHRNDQLFLCLSWSTGSVFTARWFI